MASCFFVIFCLPFKLTFFWKSGEASRKAKILFVRLISYYALSQKKTKNAVRLLKFGAQFRMHFFSFFGEQRPVFIHVLLTTMRLRIEKVSNRMDYTSRSSRSIPGCLVPRKSMQNPPNTCPHSTQYSERVKSHEVSHISSFFSTPYDDPTKVWYPAIKGEWELPCK